MVGEGRSDVFRTLGIGFAHHKGSLENYKYFARPFTRAWPNEFWGTPAATPGVVDGAARDRRLRQLAAIP